MANDDQRTRNAEAVTGVLSYAMARGAMPAPLTGIYLLPKPTPEKGKWYFGAKCPSGKHSSPLFEDPSAGKLGNPFAGSGGFQAPCYHCDQEVRAGARDVHSTPWQ